MAAKEPSCLLSWPKISFFKTSTWYKTNSVLTSWKWHTMLKGTNHKLAFYYLGAIKSKASEDDTLRQNIKKKGHCGVSSLHK